MLLFGPGTSTGDRMDETGLGVWTSSSPGLVPRTTPGLVLGNWCQGTQSASDRPTQYKNYSDDEDVSGEKYIS